MGSTLAAALGRVAALDTRRLRARGDPASAELAEEPEVRRSLLAEEVTEEGKGMEPVLWLLLIRGVVGFI